MMIKQGTKKRKIAGATSSSTSKEPKGKGALPSEEYKEEVCKALDALENSRRLFDPALEEDERLALFESVAEKGEELVRRYAWAIPDERAIQAAAEFSPIVEIGAGGGYWASLLRARGADVKAYDLEPSRAREKGKGKAKKRKSERKEEGEDEEIVFWTEVLEGGPPVLEEDGNAERALLLCYPDFDGSTNDNDEPMSLQCLQRSETDVVIHVGELFGDSILMSGSGPWGRTTAEAFQVALATQFHCVLKLDLPRWPLSGDCLTVWKRHTAAPIMYGEVDEDEEGSDDGNEGCDGGDEEGGEANGDDAEGKPRRKKKKNREGDAGGAGAGGGEERGSSKAGVDMAVDAEEEEKGGTAEEEKAEGGEESGDPGGEEEEEEEEGMMGGEMNLDMFSYIPADERMVTDAAAKGYKHLL